MKDKLLTVAAHYVGKAAVELHYRHYLDVYSVCSEHNPQRYKRTQRKAAIPTGIRWQVWKRDSFTCIYCGENESYLSLDHVVPEAHGGRIEVNNLVTACQKCNGKKGALDFETFINSKWLKKRKETIHQRTSTTKVRKQRRNPLITEMHLQIANATGRRSCSSDSKLQELCGVLRSRPIFHGYSVSTDRKQLKP